MVFSQLFEGCFNAVRIILHVRRLKQRRMIVLEHPGTEKNGQRHPNTAWGSLLFRKKVTPSAQDAITCGLLHGFLHCVRELRNIDHAEVDGCLRVLQLFLEICSVDFHHEAFHESMDVASCNLCAPRWNEVAGRPSFVFRKLFDGGADRNIA